MDNNLDKNGVVIYFTNEGPDTENWITISNVKNPIAGDKIFELPWNTLANDDGKYWLRAMIGDLDGLTGDMISDYFFIHNNPNNPPIVTFLNPNSGEFNGTIKINASIFDLENNIDNDGVNFYYSNDKLNWIFLGKDTNGMPIESENIYEYYWDTTIVADNMYWLQARANDLTKQTGFDNTDDQILIHNRIDNPPIIRFVLPEKNLPLSLRESIVVEVIDFENDVKSVEFYYTSNNMTWKLIDTRNNPETANIYKTIWSTGEIYNDLYYIKVKARDELGHTSEITEGPFEVTQGKKRGGEPGTPGMLQFASWWIIIIIIVIIILFFMIVLIMRRSKRREKELIEEVAAEVEQSMHLAGELETTTITGTDTGIGVDEDNSLQTYMPPSEAQSQSQSPSQLPSQIPETDLALAAEQEFKNLEQNSDIVSPEQTGISTAGKPPALGTLPFANGITDSELSVIDRLLPQLLPAASGSASAKPEEETSMDIELPPEPELEPKPGPGQDLAIIEDYKAEDKKDKNIFEN